MLHRQLDRMHAFFQRPGVTPARVAPWVALAILVPAFVIGSNLEPLGHQRAAHDDGSLVIAGAPQPQAPAAPSAGASAASGTAGESEASAGGESRDDAGDTGAEDSVAAFADPVAEPAFEEPLAEAPLAEPPADEDTASDETPADAQAYEGTVVHINERADSYALATAEQDLLAIHSDKLPEPGASIRTQVTALANGTWNEIAEREELDTATSAQFRGWITWAADDGSAYTVSARGVSLLVTRRAAGETLPLGAPVAASADIDPMTGALTETSLTTEGERTDTPVALSGIVRSIDAAGRKLVLSADDIGASGADIELVASDASIDLTKLEARDVLSVNAVIGADGAYTLTGLSADSGTKAADDPKLAQGDQVAAEDPDATGKLVDRLLRSLGITLP